MDVAPSYRCHQFTPNCWSVIWFSTVRSWLRLLVSCLVQPTLTLLVPFLLPPTCLLESAVSPSEGEVLGFSGQIPWRKQILQNIHNKKKKPLIQYCNPKMSFLSLRRHEQLVKPESHLSFCNSSIREMMVLVFPFILDNITKLEKDAQVFYSQIGRWLDEYDSFFLYYPCSENQNCTAYCWKGWIG